MLRSPPLMNAHKRYQTFEHFRWSHRLHEMKKFPPISRAAVWLFVRWSAHLFVDSWSCVLLFECSYPHSFHSV